MNARLTSRMAWWALAVLLAPMLTLSAQIAEPPVRVTLTADDARLKVGESTTLHVFARIAPDLAAETDQIFSWYVDLLNSSSSVFRIDADSLFVPTSDLDPLTSSPGWVEGGNLRGVYDTFLNRPGAGHDAPVELFSVAVNAAAAGTSTFRVAAGTGAIGLSADFLVAPAGFGNPLVGGEYSGAVLELSCFLNTPPALEPLADATVGEGQPLTFAARASDPDPNQTLSFSLVGAVPPGAAIHASTGQFAWTPSEAQGPGSYRFGVRVADSASPPLTVTNFFTVTVNEVNTAPRVTTPSARSVQELVNVTATCSATDADLLPFGTPSTNQLRFSLASPPAGAVIDQVTGVFIWTPTEDQGPGVYAISVVVTDDGKPPLSGTNTFTITVTEVNSPPTLAAPAAQNIAELSTLSVAFSPSDPDVPANQISFALLGAPPGVVLDAGTGVATWTPTEAQGPGVYTITVAASDNGSPPKSATNSFAVTVTELNTPPVLGVIPDQVASELSPFTVTAAATDPDLPAQRLTFSLVNPPAGATIQGNAGVISWTPSETQGGATFTLVVRVTDDGTPSSSDTKSFDVRVAEGNRAPVLTAPTDRSVPELTAFSAGFSASDPDVPANLISYRLLSAPAGVTLDAAAGVVTWTPSEAQGPGDYTISVVATDNGTPALSATNQFRVTVTEVNTAPTLTPVDDRSVRVLTTLTVTNVATDSDHPAQTLTFSLVNPPQGASITPGTGVLTWTPTVSQGPGLYTVTVVATDSGSPSRSATNSFQVSVTRDNTAPVLAPVADRTVPELSLLTLTNLVTDADLPSQSVTFALLNPPAGAAIQPTTGVFTWTPSEAQGPGVFTIAVVATDNGTPAMSATNRFQVTLTEVNSAPAVAPVVDQDIRALSTLTVTNVATDSDLPAQTLTFSLVNPPQGASIALGTGVFTWTPSVSQGPGLYTITIVATDGGSPSLSATNRFRVSVTRDNTAPVLTPVADRTVPELSLLTLTNLVTDADLPSQSVTFALLNSPAGAAIQPTTGVFTWTPSEAQGPGVFTITVVATDNGTPAMSATNRFQVTVTEVNSAPALASMADRSVRELTTLTVTNVATDGDLPAQGITFSLLNAPQGASIASDTGVLTWTPTEAQGPGSYTLRVVATDNGSPPLSATNSYQVNVTEENAAPVLAPVADRVVTELTTLTVTNTAADADLPSQTVTFALLNPPAGAAIQATTGVFTWTPSEAQGPGLFTITVVATDNGTPAMSATNRFQVTVTEVNSAPALASVAGRNVRELTTLTVTNVATDGDLPAQGITFSLLNAPQGASIASDTGVLTWTPSEAQGPGSYTLTVVATDQGSPPLSATNSYQVNVTEENTAPVLAPMADRVVTELTTLTVTNTAADADLPSQSVTFALLNPPAGAAIQASTGVFTWTPSEAQGPGLFTITVVATDNGTPAMSATNRFQVTVTEVNSAPALASVADRSVRELTTLTVTNVATDGDLPAQGITFSLLNAPLGASIASDTGVLTWTPSEAQGPGSYTLTVVATDQGSLPLSATNRFQVNVTEENTAPVIAPVADRVVGVSTTLTVPHTATDADLPSQSVSFALLDPPAGAAIQSTTGVFAWTPSEAQGPGLFTITVVATDNGTPAMSATNRFQVTVTKANSAPVLAAVADCTVPELSTLTVTNVATDPDGPGQTLTFALLGPPPGATVHPTTGVLNWTPSESQGPGEFAIVVVVTDNGSPRMSATNRYRVTVTEVNTAPLLTAGQDLSVNPGSALVVTNLASDVDVPSNALHFSLVDPPAGASIDAVSGVFAWTPTSAQASSNYVVQIRVTDDGVPALSTTRSFHVSVGSSGGGTTQPAFLTAISQDATGFKMQVTGQPRGQYRIEASTDLARWISIGTVTLGDDSTTTFVDSRSDAGTFHFYRAVAGGIGGTPPRATIANVALEADGFRMNIQGEPGARYTLEYTSDIPHWAPLENITLAQDGSLSYLDRSAITRPFGFYRINSLAR